MKDQISKELLEILEWPAIKDRIISCCSTVLGRDIIENLTPLPLEQIRDQIKKISHIKELLMRGDAMDFTGITDITPLIKRAEKGSLLNLEELVQIREFLTANLKIYNFLKIQRDEFQSLNDEFLKLKPLDALKNTLVNSIDHNNQLSKKKYPQLKKINDQIFSAKQQIEKKLSQLIHSPSMSKILREKIYTFINRRYVLLVKINFKESIKGTIHDLSSSGATAYIEPDEIRPLNNKIIVLQLELQREINNILADLTKEAAAHCEKIENNLEIISYLDFISASSKFSIDINGSEAEISEKPLINLYNAKHPLLYLMENGNVVSNNISLGVNYNCLIISGANTGGKTVLLKTIGISVIMAMYGLHIPADENSTVGIFSSIFADIGDDQNLQQSLSTFSGQILMIREMLQNAGESTLVLIDEIIVGTNPLQGAALAQAILEELADKNCKVVATTHYSALKELASRDKKFQNGSVSFDPETLKPTYKLITGLPGVSYAVEIAGNYGLPESILNRTKVLIRNRDGSAESLLEKIQREKQLIEQEKENIAKLKEELNEEKRRYIKEQNRLKRQKDEIIRKEGLHFLEELSRYRQSISGRISELQKLDLKDTGEIQKEVIAIQEKIHKALNEKNREHFTNKYLPIDPAKACAGMKVFIASLEREGKIIEIDPSGETALILFGGSIRSRFKLSDLLTKNPGKTEEPASTYQKYPKKNVNMESAAIPPVIQTSYNTIDLRGKQVAEAIKIMEDNFDKMMRNNINTVIVIHGHGTGALKKAVRENLKNSYYAVNSRPGKEGEGFDGVTVVKLRY